LLQINLNYTAYVDSSHDLHIIVQCVNDMSLVARPQHHMSHSVLVV